MELKQYMGQPSLTRFCNLARHAKPGRATQFDSSNCDVKSVIGVELILHPAARVLNYWSLLINLDKVREEAGFPFSHDSTYCLYIINVAINDIKQIIRNFRLKSCPFFVCQIFFLDSSVKKYIISTSSLYVKILLDWVGLDWFCYGPIIR